jgi:predicted lipoprotein with Yx(FWY)xxD motif
MRGRAIRVLLPLVVVGAVGAGAAMAAGASMHSSGTVSVVKSKTFGTILVAANGHTLYRFTPDRKRVSVCTGACLKFWPPLRVKPGPKPTVGSGASASLLGTIKAAHGMAQVT